MRCRSCGQADDSPGFGQVIDLGRMPLVNNLLAQPHDPCARWPLKVVFCRACSLAQLEVRADSGPPPAAMFDEYLYFSSQSQTMIAHAATLVERHVKPGQRVLEIASNDGYLLRQARERGANVLGIDPARNIAAYANAQGIPTRCEYFNEAAAADIAKGWGKADVIFANNVLAHVPDPNEIAAGIKLVLAEQGEAHVEVPYVVRMIQDGAFDTIYHEHQCYFSLSALLALFNRHDLRITDVQMIPIHGGSLHLRIAHEGDESIAHGICRQERELGVFDDSFYAGFADRVQRRRAELLAVLDEFESVGAYGAAAKGVVLLNHFGLTADRIPWIADVSPHKQGKFVPGTGQRVVSPQMLIDPQPQAVVMLAWNLQDEIIRRNRAYLERGGRFIVPMPQVRVIDRSAIAEPSLVGCAEA